MNEYIEMHGQQNIKKKKIIYLSKTYYMFRHIKVLFVYVLRKNSVHNIKNFYVKKWYVFRVYRCILQKWSTLRRGIN